MGSTEDVGESVGDLVALTLGLGSLWWRWWGSGTAASSRRGGGARGGSAEEGSGVVFSILDAITDTIVGVAENGVACGTLASQLTAAYFVDGICSVVCNVWISSGPR